MIDKGQETAEFIFGTTITRGLKQIFDTKQYESCKPGEIDDGYFCRTLTCANPEDDEQGGICYPRCNTGFKPFGCCVCTPECKPGERDDGAFCTREKCPDNTDQIGVSCYDKCRDGYTGVSSVCWENCPRGYVDNGAFCSRGGEVITKTSRDADWESCGDGYDVLGTCWKHNYKTSWGSVGCTGGRGFRFGGYDDCYTNDFPYVSKNIGDRARSCNNNETNVAGICWTKCPDDYVDDGAFCRKRIDVITKNSYMRGETVLETKIDPKPNTSYGRGAGNGMAKVDIYVKKRKADYSTKGN